MIDLPCLLCFEVVSSIDDVGSMVRVDEVLGVTCLRCYQKLWHGKVFSENAFIQEEIKTK